MFKWWWLGLLQLLSVYGARCPFSPICDCSETGQIIDEVRCKSNECYPGPFSGPDRYYSVNKLLISGCIPSFSKSVFAPFSFINRLSIESTSDKSEEPIGWNSDTFDKMNVSAMSLAGFQFVLMPINPLKSRDIGLTTLEFRRLESLYLVENTFSHLPQLSSMTADSVESFDCIDRAFVDLTLNRLSFRNVSFESAFPIEALQNMRELRQLELENIRVSNDQWPAPYLAQVSGLYSLSVRKDVSFGSSPPAEFFDRLPSTLGEVSLDGLNLSAVPSGLKSLPVLRTLRLVNCLRMTSIAFDDVSPSVEILRLNNNPISNLAPPTTPIQLRHLEIRFDKLDLNLNFFNNMPRLEEVNIDQLYASLNVTVSDVTEMPFLAGSVVNIRRTNLLNLDHTLDRYLRLPRAATISVSSSYIKCSTDIYWMVRYTSSDGRLKLADDVVCSNLENKKVIDYVYSRR